MGRYKIFALIRRRIDLSSQEFHDHYRHPHATFGMNMSTLRGYVQSHQFTSRHLSGRQDEFEAVAELWLDNEEDVRTFREERNVIAHILPDEPKFMDVGALKVLAAEEEVIASGPDPQLFQDEGDQAWSEASRPTSIKLLQFIHNAYDAEWISPEDKALGLSIGALRHVRCHPWRLIAADPPYAGVRELWWPTLTAFEQGIARHPIAWEKIRGETSHSTSMLVQAERFL